MVTLPPRPAGLPEFDHPPVDEVVLGIEFAPLRGFTQAHLGVFWNDIRADYPQTQDQIPLLDLGTLPIVIPTGLPPNAGFRTWFISNDDSSIIQVQNDRFICNWRKRGDEYPRFELIYERFSGNLAHFERVTEGLELGTLSPRRIEVTYINWITDLLPSEFFIPAATPATTSAEVSDTPTQQQWNAQYEVAVGADQPGTLTVMCGQAIRPSPTAAPQSGTQLLLTFKAQLNALDEMVNLIAVGRNVVVNTFADLTTEISHRQWGIVE